MDKFTFNFGASEPDEEITPPPTQLAGVIFSFVPAPASELTQMEKDYQNYLQEWRILRSYQPHSKPIYFKDLVYLLEMSNLANLILINLRIRFHTSMIIWPKMSSMCIYFLAIFRIIFWKQ
jgi:hypothetical protein